VKLRDENKVNIIFEASLKLIFEDGLAGLTMAKIAKKAGIATGTLYIYFKNKEVLLHELSQSIQKKYFNQFLKTYDGKLPFKKNLKKMWVSFLKHRIEYYEESIFLEQYFRSPYNTNSDMLIDESIKNAIHHLIIKGQKEELIKNNGQDELLFISTLSIIRELANQHVTGAYKLTPERIDAAFELNWDMVKA